MNIDEIKAFLSENKDEPEVKAFLSELSPEHTITPDEVNEFLKTDDGKMLIQPIVDSTVTKAVKTRDKAHEVLMDNEVKKRVAAEILKMNPQEEPWQKEMREMKDSLEAEKSERAKDKLKRELVEKAAAMGINPFFIDDYLPPSLDEGVLFLQKIDKHNKELVQAKSNELLANGYKPQAGNEKSSGKKDLTKLSQADLIRLEMEGALDAEIVG